MKKLHLSRREKLWFSKTRRQDLWAKERWIRQFQERQERVLAHEVLREYTEQLRRFRSTTTTNTLPTGTIRVYLYNDTEEQTTSTISLWTRN